VFGVNAKTSEGPVTYVLCPLSYLRVSAPPGKSWKFFPHFSGSGKCRKIFLIVELELKTFENCQILCKDRLKVDYLYKRRSRAASVEVISFAPTYTQLVNLCCVTVCCSSVHFWQLLTKILTRLKNARGKHADVVEKVRFCGYMSQYLSSCNLVVNAFP